MKVLISGASGFVGLNLCSHFNKMGLEIVRLNRSEFENKSIDLYNSDIVIHLAGKAHDFSSSINEKEYFSANFETTKKLYDSFLKSRKAISFIYFSSVKAVADQAQINMLETQKPFPQTFYGRSKLKSEEYILSNPPTNGKKFYILRPTMIHGPGNKGNLNLLYKLIKKRIPWFLGDFKNKRSFCSIDNLIFIVEELITNFNITSGIYNVCDSESLSTNMVVNIIANESNTKLISIPIPKKLVTPIVKFLEFFGLNFTRFKKLTEYYTVSNNKILNAIGKKLPLTATNGLSKTINYFNNKI